MNEAISLILAVTLLVNITKNIHIDGHVSELFLLNLQLSSCELELH